MYAIVLHVIGITQKADHLNRSHVQILAKIYILLYILVWVWQFVYSIVALQCLQHCWPAGSTRAANGECEGCPYPIVLISVYLMKEPDLKQLSMFGVELLLVPHYVVGLFAWQWFSQHPWLCTAIIIHCLWATQSEVKRTLAFLITFTQINWRLKFSQTIRYVHHNKI